MRAVDTNVLVRLLVSDEPAQAEAAERALAAETAFVSKTVMLELEWALRSVYGRSRVEIASAVDGLLASAGIVVEDHAVVQRAVDWLKDGIDFADALHLASSAHVDAFVTFDTALRRRATALGAEPAVVSP
jgi:predicted nucleic-acid-binding protein